MSPTEALRTARLTLTPLDPKDAVEMVGVLSDPTLYTFTGGVAPTSDELGELYRLQSAGCPRPDEIWHNWILRLGGVAIGLVQATVIGDSAELAWVVGVPWQGVGYATEAALAMRDWLTANGVASFSAHIHPEHTASNGVAIGLGLADTGEIDDEGELIWA